MSDIRGKEVGEHSASLFYRDPNLTNKQAIVAMQEVSQKMIDTALACRRDLLNLGFRTQHSMCRELDIIARNWDTNFMVLRRQVELPERTT